MKVAVFGASGMLGTAVTSELKKYGFQVVTVGREGCDLDFSVGQVKLKDLDLSGIEYAINCIGLISHVIEENSLLSRSEAASINSVFPHELSALAESQKFNVIQIATDCVFSGSTGMYRESSAQDARDVYGKTKSMGEVKSPNFMNMRTSIVGRESRGYFSLLEWVIRQPLNSQLNGFTDREWNGVTTDAFARIVRGVLENGLFKPGVQHIVPQNSISKAELVRLIASEFGRKDITVLDGLSGAPKNMTLATENPKFNEALWLAAGYPEVPTIQEMIREISV